MRALRRALEPVAEHIASVDLIRDLQPGDFIMVRVHNDLKPETTAKVREAIIDALGYESGVRILIVPHNYVEEVKAMDLGDLLELRSIIDLAIMEQTPGGGTPEA
jgi:hypothetical protein